MAKIRLIAADKKYNIAPFYITPVFDESKKVFLTGQIWDKDPEIAKKQKENCPLIIDENESYQLKHLKVFDDEVEVDVILLNLVKINPEIALNRASVIPGKHRFYLEDKEEEAIEDIAKAELQFQAMTIIKGLSLEDMSEMGMLNGMRVKDLTKKQIEAALIKKSSTDPREILNTWNDKDRKAKVFLGKLLQNNILRLVNGKYVFGEETIAVNEQYALEYLKDKQNNVVITQWANTMKSAVAA